VAGLLAYHELRGRTNRLGQAGRRASTDLLHEFLVENDVTQVETSRPRHGGPSVVRRAAPALLFEHIDERRPQAVRATVRRRVTYPARAPRPTRLVPLTV